MGIYKKYSECILKEISVSRKLRKASEDLQAIQLKQQQLIKKFKVSDASGKNKIKPEIIKLHKQVKAVEVEFERAMISEPINLEEIKEDVKMSNLQEPIKKHLFRHYKPDAKVLIFPSKNISKSALSKIIKIANKEQDKKLIHLLSKYIKGRGVLNGK